MLRSLLLGLSIGTLSSARHAKHAALISLHTRRDALRAGGAAGLIGSGLISSPAVATPAASVPPFDPMGPHMMAAASLPEQLIWETETQSFRPPLTIESALAEKPRVVFVGEQHDDPRHHAVQLTIARCLNFLHRERGRDGPVAIGCEYFQRQQQPILDEFVAGTPATHNLNWLREKTNWERTWGWDFKMYAMLFFWAQKHGVRLVGLNAPEPVVRIVRERSFVQYPELLRILPQRMDLANVAHRVRFENNIASASSSMGRPVPEAASMQRLYEVQTLWEEYMADSCANHINERGGTLVVCAGSAHIEHRDGLPDRVGARLSVQTALVPASVRRRRQAEIGLPVEEGDGGAEREALAELGREIAANATLPSSPVSTFTVIPKTIELPVAASGLPSRFPTDYADWVWLVGTDFGMSRAAQASRALSVGQSA